MLAVMNVRLVTALVLLLPVCVLFCGSAIMFFKERRVPLLLQLLGTGCLTVVVLTHVCEALYLFPSMHWGDENSVGHYLDLGSAILGLTLFPAGYLHHALIKHQPKLK
jgi:hypothetical protein